MVFQNSLLPDPKKLIWAHSVCSKAELIAALSDERITAIESDIIMGYEKDGANEPSSNIQPVMAHDPSNYSDLTFHQFMETTMNSIDSQHKHLKLDIKHAEAIDPIVNILTQRKTPSDITIFLNADILKGPGRRNLPLDIEANDFLQKCLPVTQNNGNFQQQFAFSLSWRVDCRSSGGYTMDDIQEMKELIEKYELEKRSAGIVLAVNARVLAKDPTSFTSILKEHPMMQLLIWTGTGEPPIPRSQIDTIEKYFDSIGCSHQLGFDCQIASTAASGFLFESVVQFASIFWRMQGH